MFVLQLEVEVPLAADTPWPPPLVEAVPQETFDEFIAPPPVVEEVSFWLFYLSKTDR